MGSKEDAVRKIRTFDEGLIELVQHPFLYEKTDKNFRKTTLKKRTFEFIAEALQEGKVSILFLSTIYLCVIYSEVMICSVRCICSRCET